MQTIVPYNPSADKLLLLNFTEANTELTDEIINDTSHFTAYINQKLKAANATYGIGGYDEHRTVYSRSKVFDTNEEPRRLHLGIDIWGDAGTPVYAPIDGTVHSFAFNDRYGDYGATIILSHTTNGQSFHTLYGHLSLNDLNGLSEGQTIKAGREIAHFGEPEENGHWPPHLHFQMINDMEGMKGDYPGVCKFSERALYLANCPNPDVLLQMMNRAVSH
jgi:murein DD-endopeptidase MepM/ murein hydrolase activator NlpD